MMMIMMIDIGPYLMRENNEELLSELIEKDSQRVHMRVDLVHPMAACEFIMIF